MDNKDFDRHFDSTTKLVTTGFKFFGVIWVLSALVGLGLTGAVIYLIIKLASHL